MDVEFRPATGGRPAVEVHRSHRRRRGAAARPRGEVVVVRLPAGLPAAEEERLITGLVDKVTGQVRVEAMGGDAALRSRADALADRYLDGIRASSVTFSSRMTRLLGSCSPDQGTIRIAREVAAFPGWVRDYVLIHELAHLQVGDHSPAFHELLARYPHAERARGWVEGYHAGRLAGTSGQSSEASPPEPSSVAPPSSSSVSEES